MRQRRRSRAFPADRDRRSLIPVGSQQPGLGRVAEPLGLSGAGLRTGFHSYRLMYTRHTWTFRGEAYPSRPIAAWRLLAIEPCYASSERLALGSDGRTALTAKLMRDGYT